MDLETSQVAARHFVKLAMIRQKRGTTARNTDKGGHFNISASRRPRGVYETTDRPATPRNDIDQAKQAV